MNRSVCRSAVVVGLVALLGLGPSASVLAETVAVPVVDKAKPAEAPAITKEQALALIKRYFPVPEGGTMEARLQHEGSGMTWHITYWIARTNGGRSGHGMAEIDARTGQIRYVRLRNSDVDTIRTGPLPAPRPESEARAKAWQLVQQLYPANAPILRPSTGQSDPSFDDGLNDGMADQYQFTWEPYHGDVPVEAGAVTVTVDKYTLDYTGVTAHFPKLTFPAGAATVTPAEALRLYRQRAHPRLAYLPVSERTPFSYDRKTSEVKLVYRLEQSAVLDAISGRFVDISGEDLPKEPEPEAVPSDSTKAVRPAQLPLTEDAAMAVTRELLGLPDGGHLDSDGSNFPGRENYWQLYFDDGKDSISVTLDLQTGLIHGAYRDRGRMISGEAPVTPVEPAQHAKAKAAAITIVQRYYSQLAGELKLESQPEMLLMNFQGEIPFTFRRYVNGIPMGYDGVSVAIDPATLAWTQISMEWTENVAFPKPDGAMTPAQAVERFFSGSQPRLVYSPKLDAEQFQYGPDGPYRDEEHPLEAMLNYEPGLGPVGAGSGMIDARTGEPLDWSGHPRADHPAVSKVPAGHWAEGELRYLLAQRAIAPEQVKPDAPLTRAEALRILLGTKQLFGGYYSGEPLAVPYKDIKQDDPLYEVTAAAIDAKVLKPGGDNPVFGGDQPVTRAEFAVWVSRAIELDQLARSGLTTTSSFKDIAGLTAEERNAIAFLQALGILVGGDTFRGSAQITQAEAAAMTVRMIQYQQRNR